MSGTGSGPETELAESGAWKKPGCSLQDLPPRGRPARPRRRNALGREPRCSLQADRLAVSDHAAVAAHGCERRHGDGSANSSSDSRGERRATSAGYRGSPGRIRDRPGACDACTRRAVEPDTPADCKQPGQDDASKVERLAGNTGSSAAGKSLPPRYVWAPTLRKSDPPERRRQCRVWCRVPTASSPMGFFTANAAPLALATSGQSGAVSRRP